MASISITIPYDASLGKNTTHEYGGKSVVRKNTRTTKNQDAISYELMGARNNPIINFEQDVVDVWIHVVRPKDPRVVGPRKDVDPVNFQPAICDAIEQGINVDDSFFQSRVTWSVIAEGEKPSITITVTQGREHGRPTEI